MTTTRDHLPAGAGTEVSGAPPFRYTGELANALEARWQQRWADDRVYETPREASGTDPRAKAFVMDMFPYPSGAGLHVGHPLGYIATDVFTRHLRMTGHDVLYTMGFDAFGLPAEQYAVQTGTHPRVSTEANQQAFLRQIRRLGLGHDESRRVSTIDPSFVRWTQWMFARFFDSWYDPDAAGGRGAARPITELADAFAAGGRPLPDGVPGVAPDADWAALDDAARARVLDRFRLAYADTSPVNWCPGLGTVLSNEEVTPDGRSERGNFPVFVRDLRQWKMRITAYAERLLDDLDRVDWPESVRAMQRNWIGRSSGARITFAVSGAPDAADAALEVFTTRPDTLFGATFMVVNTAHPLLADLPGAWPAGTDPAWTGGAPDPAAAVTAYRAESAARTGSTAAVSDGAEREKTGVFTGLSATNPATGAAVPVFVGDYVLAGYGTGAIMAVPGQDERDHDFADRFNLPVVRTVAPPAGWEGGAYTGEGPAIASANGEISLDGMDVASAKAAMTAWLVARGSAEQVVQYRLRDWLFSRQRYWGEPFPVVYDEAGTAHRLPDSMLPLQLPEVADYAPVSFDPDDADSEPRSPLDRATDWVHVDLDLGRGAGPQRYRRDTSTMPNWAGSCWYELRYTDPGDPDAFADPELERYWMGPGRGAGTGVADDPGGVDLYVGGVEHAVLHLLYSRFWHKVLFDLGLVSSEEPFRRLFNQGYIQAYAYTDARGFYVPAEEVVEDGSGAFTFRGEPVAREYGKIGKSLRNVVTPDEICDRYGADTFRLYEMSMGPLADSRPWSTRDVVGSLRFLQRLWRLVLSEETGEPVVRDEAPDADTARVLHRTIAGVGADLAGLRPNTAAAKLIELVNHETRAAGPTGGTTREVAQALVLMVAPLCPHLAEELWHRLGHETSLVRTPFPVADPAWLVADTVEYPVQVDGKVRARVSVPADADGDAVRAVALAEPRVAELLAGAEPRRVVVVPGRLVNVVR